MKAGQRALLRISELNVTEYHTLASLGIRMHVVGLNAKLLRDQAGNNMDYYTNSITLGGGESADVILDSCLVRSQPLGRVLDYTKCTTPIPSGTYYLYTSNLDHLSNDAENFGGQMTEVRVAELKGQVMLCDNHQEDSMQRLLPLVPWLAHGLGGAGGRTRDQFDQRNPERVQPDGADGALTQPDGQSIYSWGYGCATGSTPSFVPATITTGFCSTMQVPGPTLS